MKTTIPIDGGFYVDDSLPVSGQRLVNAYVDVPQTSTITTATLRGTSGLEQLASVSDINTWRGSHEMAGLPYFVIGKRLVRLDRALVATVATFTTTDLGEIEGTGPVSMDDNGTQLVIVVPGVNQYVFIEGTGIAEITDASFDGPVDSVLFINSKFVFPTTDGKKFINSPVNDARGAPLGAAYDALDFNVAEADPDNIRGAVNFSNTLYVLGSQTTQAFQDIGRTPSPFAPIPGSVLPVGLLAPFSIQKAQNTFMMIGGGENEGPAIWRFAGNGYTKISTTAVDTLLNGLTDTELSTVTSWAYAEKGAYFVGWSLPSTCIIFNQTTQKWHEQLSTYEDTDNTYRAAGMITAYGDVLVGDRRSGIIGRLATSVKTEYDNLIKRFAILRPFDNLGEVVAVAMLEVVMESGVGNSDVEDPQLRLSWSDDGGRTFNNELSRSFGKVGEYWIRAIWNRLGSFPRSRVMKLEFSEPAKFVMVKVEADVA